MESPKKNRSRNDPYYALLLKHLRGAQAGDVKSHRWVVDHSCVSHIESAKAGHAESGEWLLRQFCATVRNNRRVQGKHTQFNEELLDYIADAFAKILDDVSPKKALGIGKQRGHPPMEDKFHRDAKICTEILKHRRSDKNVTIEDAKEAANETLKYGRATIDRAWKNKYAKEAAEEFPNLDLA